MTSSSTGSPTTSCWSSRDPTAYDRFYNVIANPILWFIQHYLWDLSNAPDIRQRGGRRLGLRLQGRQRRHRATRCSRRSRARRAAGDAPRLPPLHAARASSARRARTRSSTTSSTSPGPSRTPGGSSPADCARRSTAACSPTTSSASTPRLLPQLPPLLPGADGARGRLRARARCCTTGRETWVRAYPLRSTPGGSTAPRRRPASNPQGVGAHPDLAPRVQDRRARSPPPAPSARGSRAGSCAGRRGVEADDVVGEHALVDLLAHVARAAPPGVGLRPRDVDEVVEEQRPAARAGSSFGRV